RSDTSSEQPASAAAAAKSPEPSPKGKHATESRSRPVLPPPASDTAPDPAESLPDLPTVRRGGYDKSAVDRHMRTLVADKADIAGHLEEAQSHNQELASQLETLRERLKEHEEPTYAGLGGRASEMLRLAEEQAAEVLDEARRHAADSREQAQHDAAAVRAQAESEVEDMRRVQTSELDEHRSRTMAQVESERK